MGEGRTVLIEDLVGPGIIEGGRVERVTSEVSGKWVLELSAVTAAEVVMAG